MRRIKKIMRQQKKKEERQLAQFRNKDDLSYWVRRMQDKFNAKRA